MKFTRRAEGIKSARLIFSKSRQNPKATYQVFVAAAWMEYYCSKVIISYLNDLKLIYIIYWIKYFELIKCIFKTIICIGIHTASWK